MRSAVPRAVFGAYGVGLTETEVVGFKQVGVFFVARVVEFCREEHRVFVQGAEPTGNLKVGARERRPPVHRE